METMSMKRRDFTAAVAGLPLVAGVRLGASIGAGAGAARAAAFSLGQDEAAAGIRTALARGADAAVDRLGTTDGFLGNARVRIPLPGILADSAGMLRMLGQQKKVDDLVTAMNRAAEGAVPEARSLLVNAAKAMTVDDALRIVRGGETAVTDFFASKTREPLHGRFLPIVTQWTAKVSLAEKYNAVASRANSFGLVKQEDANVEQYVTRKALDGLFLMIGDEEKKIRADPAGTGSELLRRVFGR
jgi:hypothetical protein